MAAEEASEGAHPRGTLQNETPESQLAAVAGLFLENAEPVADVHTDALSSAPQSTVPSRAPLEEAAMRRDDGVASPVITTNAAEDATSPPEVTQPNGRSHHAGRPHSTSHDINQPEVPERLENNERVPPHTDLELRRVDSVRNDESESSGTDEMSRLRDHIRRLEAENDELADHNETQAEEILELRAFMNKVLVNDYDGQTPPESVLSSTLDLPNSRLSDGEHLREQNGDLANTLEGENGETPERQDIKNDTIDDTESASPNCSPEVAVPRRREDPEELSNSSSNDAATRESSKLSASEDAPPLPHSSGEPLADPQSSRSDDRRQTTSRPMSGSTQGVRHAPIYVTNTSDTTARMSGRGLSLSGHHFAGNEPTPLKMAMPTRPRHISSAAAFVLPSPVPTRRGTRTSRSHMPRIGGRAPHRSPTSRRGHGVPRERSTSRQSTIQKPPSASMVLCAVRQFLETLHGMHRLRQVSAKTIPSAPAPAALDTDGTLIEATPFNKARLSRDYDDDEGCRRWAGIPLSEVQQVIRDLHSQVVTNRGDGEAHRSPACDDVEQIQSIGHYLEDLDSTIDSLAQNGRSPEHASQNPDQEAVLTVIDMLHQHLHRLQDAIGRQDWARAATIRDELMNANSIEQNSLVAEAAVDVAPDFDNTSDNTTLHKYIHDLLERNEQLERALAERDAERASAEHVGANKTNNWDLATAAVPLASAPLPGLGGFDDHCRLHELSQDTRAAVESSHETDVGNREQARHNENQRDRGDASESGGDGSLQSLASVLQNHKVALSAALKHTVSAVARFRQIESHGSDATLSVATDSSSSDEGDVANPSGRILEEEVVSAAPCPPVPPTYVDAAVGTHEEEEEEEVEAIEPMPEVQDEAEFRVVVVAALDALKDEPCSVPAIAEALGTLRVAEQSSVDALDVLRDGTWTDAIEARARASIVERRLRGVAEWQARVVKALCEAPIDDLVACRHEFTVVARKAKVLGSWLAAVDKTPAMPFARFEAAIAGLSEVIDTRGGWRSCLELPDGSVNENLDPGLWPEHDALKIWARKFEHATKKLDAEREVTIGLRTKVAALETDLKDALDRREADDERASREEVHAAVPHDDEDEDGSAWWHRERLAAAKVHVDLATTLHIALKSELAKTLTLSPPPELQRIIRDASLGTRRPVARPKTSLVAKAPVPDSTSSLNAAFVLEKHQLDKTRFALSRRRPLSSTTQRPATTANQTDNFVVTTTPPVVAATAAPQDTPVQRKPKMPPPPAQAHTSVRSALDLLKAVEAKVSSESVHHGVVAGLERDAADLRVLSDFVKHAVERDKELATRVALLEREIDILVRAQVASQKSAASLEAAYTCDDGADLIRTLRCELGETQDKLARAESAILVLEQTTAATAQDSSGPGQLELLEAMMRRHQQVSAIHAALLPKYDEVDAKLKCFSARLSETRSTASDAHSVELACRRDELEHRLYLAFRDVEAVEKLMIRLYERVEAATQYVFSGQSYRGMLIWAADKEAHLKSAQLSPRLAAAARTVAPPARTFLKGQMPEMQQPSSSPGAIGQLQPQQPEVGDPPLVRTEVRKMEAPYVRQTAKSSAQALAVASFGFVPSAAALITEEQARAAFHVKPKLRPVRSAFTSARARNTYQ